MGYPAKLSADVGGLSDYDIAQLNSDGLHAEPLVAGGPIDGFVLRDGQVLAYTLDTSLPVPQIPRVVPEQVAIAALFLASLVAPLWHLLG